MKAKEKLVIITTTCVNAQVLNPDAKDILVKYVSQMKRKADLEWARRMAHRNASGLVDAACGWYATHITQTYKGFTMAALSDGMSSMTLNNHH